MRSRPLAMRTRIASGQHVAKFETYERSLELVAALRPVIEAVERRDRNLTDQIKRASVSIPLNLSEGTQRIGGDRANLYRVASGSAAELQTAVAIAVAWGYVNAHAAAPAQELIARIRAMLWRLLHPSAARKDPV